MRERAILAASVCLSLVYLFGIYAGPGRFAVKAGSIVALAAIAWLRGHLGVAAGLFLSSIGDALLDLGSGLFTAGLFAFLCAHVVYTATFARNRSGPPPGVGRWLAIAAVAAFSGSFAVWLLPSVGGLAIPVILYMFAITTMVAASIVARAGAWVPVGAVLFLISDAILAANRFKTAVPGRGYLVWITYYAGQLLIALGFVRRAWTARGTERSRTAPAERGTVSPGAGRGSS